MKRFFGILFFLIIITACGIAAYLAVNIIEKNEFAVEIDRKNKIVKRSYDSGIRLIYRAMNIRDYEVLRYPKTGVKNVNVKVFLPELADLNDDAYSLNAGFEITYEIMPEKFIVEYDALGEDLVQEKLNRVVEAVLSGLVNSVFSLSYDVSKIDDFSGLLDTNGRNNIISDSDRYGINITDIKRNGNFTYPSLITYESGVQYKTELNELRRRQNIELENLKHSLSKLNLQEDQYFEKLKKMSVILKENPLMLKYIYIDKISPNVKMILPVGMSGYPLDINDNNSGDSSKSGEIDNLK